MAEDTTEAEEIRVVKRATAIVLTVLGLASGGGIGTFAASAQTDKSMTELKTQATEQDKRVQRLETDVAVIKNDTSYIKANQEDTKKRFESLDDKLDKVLDEVRK